jgi:hypothetical protein
MEFQKRSLPGITLGALITGACVFSSILTHAQPGPRPQGSEEMRQAMLLLYDEDGDGRLNEKEREKMRSDLRKDAEAGRGPGGFGGPPGGRRQQGFGGPPGGGMMGGGARQLVEQFDLDMDGRLNANERQAAVEFLAEEQRNGGGNRRRPRFGGGNQEPPKAGIQLSPAEVKNYPDHDFYDLSVVRTLFLEFENDNWETEMAAFNNTDVEVPARLTIDGERFDDVGVHFRGASSFFTVGEGRKRSMNVSIDWIHDKADYKGYQTLNLLNSHTDASFLRTVLTYQISGKYIPTPQANFVRVVINGENWGIYVNAQQFNKDFLEDGYGTRKGTRWKTPGSPRGQANFAYLGDDVENYKRFYSIKSKEKEGAWDALINFTRVLNETPPDKLKKALDPILDIDGTLKFLALENVLVNKDGYWIRSSDYNLYLDPDGRFHVIPHDANETFNRPGGGRGNQVEGFALDPLAFENDDNKPLISKLLAVPELKQRYLKHVKDIAENWLDWEKLGPIAREHHALIAEDVKIDTRKLTSNDAFEKSLDGEFETQGMRGRQRGVAIKEFAEQRREYLLNHPAIKGL